MSTLNEASVASATYTRPLPLARRASDRRIEVFSPKLGRRLSLSSYAAWQLWLALEANPAVAAFCERPAALDGSPRRTLDFWVRFNRVNSAHEFWLLVDETDDDATSDEAGLPASSTSLPKWFRGTALRLIPRSTLRAWSIPVASWAQMVPHLVTWRRFADPLLAQSIAGYLGQYRSLDDILERFADNDSAMAEAALYSLVANGRVLSPDLSTSPLSGSTRFRRA